MHDEPVHHRQNFASSPRFWVVLGVLVALFIGIRLIHLTADAPDVLPNGHFGWRELLIEGPAKAQEARNKALFGQWKTNPADNYQFWRAQSPAWVYPLSWFFEAFGVGYAQLRAFSILTSVVALVGVLWIAARRFDGWLVVVAGVLLSVNYYYVLCCRAGLLEPMLNSFVVFCVLFVLLAFRTPLWLIAAQLSLAAAFLTKQTALLLLPVFVIGTAWAMVRDRRSGGAAWRRVLPVLTLALLVGLLTLYVSRDAYWRTIVWNFGHMFLDDTTVGEVEVARVSAGEIAARVFAWSRWRKGFFLLMPVAAPLILLELGRLAVSLARRRAPDEWDSLVTLWFLSVLGSLQLTPLTALRYYVVLMPPAVLLAAGGLSTLISWSRSRGCGISRGAVLSVVLIAVALTHVRWFVQWAREPEYKLVATNRDIRTQIGDREAVLIGKWAAPLALETPYEVYYVKRRFNESRKALAQLGVTHLLVRHRGNPTDWLSRDDGSYWTFKKTFPRAAADAEIIETYRLWGGYFADLRAVAARPAP